MEPLRTSRPAGASVVDVRCRLAVRVRDLKLALGDGARRKQVLNGVNLNLQSGRLHFILGPNGCGKSTLLRVLAGIIPGDSGTVRADSPVGFVFQNPDHQVVMPTVAADVAFSLGARELPDSEVRSSVEAALDAVGMLDCFDAPMSSLSGGQKQRVAIAGALVSRPSLLLLDELTTFLDEGSRRRVLECVRGVVGGRRDNTGVWVTHRFEELEFADSAAYMEEGRVLCAGEPAEVVRYVRSLGAKVGGGRRLAGKGGGGI
eukprot:evm.model.scf_4428.2 EVM.evm.TU.scf_4428.2   scf_4428:6089-6868(-)